LIYNNNTPYNGKEDCTTADKIKEEERLLPDSVPLLALLRLINKYGRNVDEYLK